MAVNVEFYKSVIAGCFPELALKTLKFIGGSKCRVFIANGDTYFRFSHSDQALEELPREKEIYELVAGRLTVSVPRFTLYSAGCAEFPYPVAGYSQVQGVPLGDRPLTSKAARQIGAFLKSLHAIPPPPKWKSQPIPSPRERSRKFLQRVAPISRVLSPGQWSWFTGQFDQFASDPLSQVRPTPVLVHGDIDIQNILIDTKTEDLSGIIDFELSHVGDPVVDFTALRGETGSERTGEAVAAYGGPPDAGFEMRLKFWSSVYAAHELSYGIEQNAEVHIVNGQKRLARAMAGEDIIGGWGLVATSGTASWRGIE